MASISTISCPAMASSRTAFRNSKLLGGLQCMKLHPASNYASGISSIQIGAMPMSFFSTKSSVKTKATSLSGGVDLRSHPIGSIFVVKSAIALGTLAAETTPTKGFSSIPDPEAIKDIRQGKMVVVVDDENRENEGDLIMAAAKVTPEAVAFIVKHGTGIVCVCMKEDDLERLDLPLMVASKENEEKLHTAFTVTVVCSFIS